MNIQGNFSTSQAELKNEQLLDQFFSEKKKKILSNM